jgi:cellulose synthase/poly-beta-1,6-N-acetylglucosamine synthase-like glycosyltransferase
VLVCFWICFGVVAYIYLGYPLLLRAGLFGRRLPQLPSLNENSCHRATKNKIGFPLVSILVAAHNEQNVIETKILNLLASDYPRERLEILIGSDGSSDRTEEIVGKYEALGVGLVSFPQQLGKSAMQNGLVAKASGEILVFTDADCTCDRSAVGLLAQDFADPEVGLVTAAPRYINESETAITKNESVYLRYESWLREEESRHGLLAMASGSLFAMRRSLWHPLARDLGDDFELPLRVAQAGMLNVLESRAVTTTLLTQKDARSVFNLKTRIVSKDFKALLAYRSVLNPLAHPAIATSLFSHKLLRWLAPYFLLGMLFSSAFLNAPVYRVLFWLQLSFCLLALLGYVFRGKRLVFPWSVPTSFCVVNLAALVGVWMSLTGHKSGRWTPVREH